VQMYTRLLDVCTYIYLVGRVWGVFRAKSPLIYVAGELREVQCCRGM
jgi:hypothetical protein